MLGLANGVAAMAFVFFGDVRWSAVIPLGAGLLVGGRLGPVVVRRTPGDAAARRDRGRRAGSGDQARDRRLRLSGGQSDAPERRRWRIRHVAMPSATAETITSRTTASPPAGMPLRIRRSGGSSRRPTKMARDSHVGESWAMPVRAAPSRRSTRNTNASDHTAVRLVRHPMAMNTAM